MGRLSQKKSLHTYGHIEHVFGDIVPRGACRKKDKSVSYRRRGRDAHSGSRGDPACITALRVTAEQHALNDISDVSWLIEGDCIRQADVARAIPVIEEYLTKAVVPGGVGRKAGKGGFDSEGRLVFDGEVSDPIDLVLCAIIFIAFSLFYYRLTT